MFIGALSAGRTRPAVDFSTDNSSALGTVPYGLLHTRAAALEPDNPTCATFAIWFKYSTLPTSKYILARLETASGANTIEIHIARNRRVGILIGEIGRSVAGFYSAIGSAPNDNAWRHLCVVINTRVAQEERRANVLINGIESPMSVANPPAYGASVSAIAASSKVYALGTATAATQFNGSAALEYIMPGRVLAPTHFILGTGAGAVARVFAGVDLPGDLYLPLADDINDAFNGATFTALP